MQTHQHFNESIRDADVFFFKLEKISEKKKKKLFISSFEVDTLNKEQVSYRMMMMNMRSAFLG